MKTILWNTRIIKIVIFGVVTIFLSLVIGGNGGLFAGSCDDGQTSPDQLSKKAIIDLTNDVRAVKGLCRLAENPLLNDVAEARAKDMIAKQYFGHVSPTDEGLVHFATRMGYKYRLISENMAVGNFSSNNSILECWLCSPHHRKNIMSAKVRDIGVSLMRGKIHGVETLIVVQVIGLQST
jgi:uncharacterized protein YkwD